MLQLLVRASRARHTVGVEISGGALGVLVIFLAAVTGPMGPDLARLHIVETKLTVLLGGAFETVRLKSVACL